jgi:hypothetical protein
LVQLGIPGERHHTRVPPIGSSLYSFLVIICRLQITQQAAMDPGVF